MIEVICKENDKKTSDESALTQKLISSNNGYFGAKIPKNIKQIGNVTSEEKIFIEDYAFTYINSVAYQASDEEIAGVLLGDYQYKNDNKYVFIKGVVKAKQHGGKKGIHFDEKVWNEVYDDIGKFFPKLEVVGWFVAIPKMTTERMQFLKRIHADNFVGRMKTLFVVEKAQKEENFYLFNGQALNKQAGYICFYERNNEMQEYILCERGNKPIEDVGSDTVMKSIRSILQEKENNNNKKGENRYIIAASVVLFMAIIGLKLVTDYKNDAGNITKVNTDMNNIIPVNVIYESSECDENNTQEATEQEETIKDIFNYNVDKQEKTIKTMAKKDETQQNMVEETKKDKTEQEQQLSDDNVYTVVKGDTITSISWKKYGTTKKIPEIIAYNNLTNGDKLSIGQEIKLP